MLRGLDPNARIVWYGPAMGARSFATARLMETWAHGQDVADAVGVHRLPTARLRHVAHIGVRARPFSYATRNRPVPEGEVFVALDPPGGGEPWTWGDEGAADRVTGPALDFCLVVTQRRHLDDTALVASTARWPRTGCEIAQAFAGPPGDGPQAGPVPAQLSRRLGRAAAVRRRAERAPIVRATRVGAEAGAATDR